MWPKPSGRHKGAYVKQRMKASPKKAAAPKKDRVWFERKVFELKAELEKLPADRQAQLELKFEQERNQ